MCGICGIVGPEAPRPESGRIVRAMMETLAHRGPDAEGLAGDSHFVFGHRRLSIIDLELGAQPMTTPDGLITIAYNGEVYNYLELRQDLIRRGVKFKTFSDTEVLLRLYETDGPGCVSRLNGMFAFVIWDARKNLFFAARDHFGIKPFYYATLPEGGLIFASEIKALLRHPAVRPALDPASLNHYLTFQFCLGARTLFSGVEKLPPAHTLTWRPGEAAPAVRRYWTLSYQVDTHHTEEYFTDRLLLLLQDSVKGQLQSDVPLGAYLSGGIDSSSVASLAARQYGDHFQCFTGRFAEGEAYDESPYARLVAEKIGSRLHEIVPTAGDFVALLPTLIYHMDEPAAGPGLFPQYMVSKLAREHVTVVLGGQGGDELLGGYARYLVAYLEQCVKGAIFETQEEGRHIVTLDSIIPNLPLLRQYGPMLKAFWRDGLFEPMDRRYFRLVDRSHDLSDILHPDVRAAYDREAIFGAFSNIFNHPETASYFNKMTHFDRETLLPALLQVEDRVSMAVSLESRVPLLDPRIAELVARMPPTLKFKGGETKYVLRRAMQSFLPEAVMSRKDKMGFPVPLSEWWEGPLREFVCDTLLGERARSRGIFDPCGLAQVVEKEGRFGRQVWGALCLELWHRIFIDGDGLARG